MQHYPKEILALFPMADVSGSDTTTIKTQQMQKVAQIKTPLTLLEIKNMIEQHHQFLSTGGAGGKWQTLLLSGMVIGIYVGAESTAGNQAIFEKQHISSEFDLQEVTLPFANFCGVYCKSQDFSEANLSHCLFTDAYLENTIFMDTNLQKSDFSRANLRNVSFMNADLRGADFENCDLTNADFTGAYMDNTRFPGAILKNITY
ncbi:MAG: pentapeptide repeat-containing protein [Saprospiraceae bacterium]